jgi:hypothetical protein
MKFAQALPAVKMKPKAAEDQMGLGTQAATTANLA